MIRLFFWFVQNSAPGRLRQYLGLAALIAATGIVELLALSCMALFITSLTTLDQVFSSRYVTAAKEILGPTLFEDTHTFYLSLGLLAIVLVLVKNAFTAVHTFITARLDGAMNVDFGTRMLVGITEMPFELVSSRNSAELMQTVGWRVCISTLTGGMMTILSDIIIAILLLGSLVVIEPMMMLVMILILGTVGMASTLTVKRMILELGMRSRACTVSVGKAVMNGIQGLREVKLFEAQAMVGKDFRRYQQEDARTKALSRVVERFPVWLFETVGMGGLVAGSLFMLSSADVSSARAMGTLSMLAVSAWRILPGMYRMVSVVGTINSYVPYLAAVKELVEEIDTHRDKERAVARAELPLHWKQVELQDIGFRYANTDAYALTEIDLVIRQGECIGIIGHSGAGKSTLADLLVGLLRPSAGLMSLDGHPVDDASQGSWCRQVGLVSQQPYLFDGTVAQNVAFSLNRGNIDHERVERSCALAGVAEFLECSPMGLDTPIGERGTLLSGGQGQRVAIARALYRDPRLLVFDEATSSLDDKNERIVHETIRSLRGRATIVIIAHRLRAVQDCDRIVWLEDGRIHRVGAADEILPLYACEQNEEPS